MLTISVTVLIILVLRTVFQVLISVSALIAPSSQCKCKPPPWHPAAPLSACGVLLRISSHRRSVRRRYPSHEGQREADDDGRSYDSIGGHLR